MLLAEALLERASLQKKYLNLISRCETNACVVHTLKAQENVEDLLKQASTVLEQLNNLIVRINKVNRDTVDTASNRTLSDLLTERDSILEHKKNVQKIIKAAYADRSYGDKVYQPAVDVKMLEDNVEWLTSKFNELDKVIQKLNWRTEI